jgi:protein tyrosine phosphatase
MNEFDFKENKELITCLNNVLTLAEERMEQYKPNTYMDAEILIGEGSIKIVKSFLYKIQNSNIVLAKDKNNK